MNTVIDVLRAWGVECHTRREWGSPQEAAGSYAKRGRTHPMPKGPARYHFLHITVTSDTDTVRQGAAGARQIERYGYSSPPMVSYQDLITNEGRYFQGQDYGTKGTHTVNDKNVAGYPHNLNLYGYACALMQNVGDAVTDVQVELAARVFAARELLGLVERGASILPHRLFAYKACPGDRAVERLPEIRKLRDKYVAAGLPGLNRREDDDVAAEDVWEWDGVPNPFPEQQKANPELQPKWVLAHTLDHARQANRKAASTEAKVNALVDAMERLAPGVKAAAEKGAREALAEGITLTVSTKE